MTLANVIDRQLRTKGRPMVLKRRVGTGDTFTSATVRGYATAYNPDEIQGALQQGDRRVTIGSDTGSVGDPQRNDILVDGGQEFVVLGSTRLMVGARIAGYRVWDRGGA